MSIMRIKKVTSTKFVAEMRKRADSMRGAEIAARIQVPSDLSWWYYLEFGTATRASSDRPSGGPTSAYAIDPLTPEGFLHWTEDGISVFSKGVTHPGIRPHPFVRMSILAIMAQFSADVRNALTSGSESFRVTTLRKVLMEQTMVYAKALLVSNLEVAAPGTREDGNLLGDTAASVFDEEAEIVDASDFSPGNEWTKPSTPRVKYVVSRSPGTRGSIRSKVG